MLETVLQYGTAKDAALDGQFAAGKTGTTTNYADAWFVGYEQPLHGRRLGRLSGQARADDDPVRRRPGPRRHLPGSDLARLHGRGRPDRGSEGPTASPAPRSRSRRAVRNRAAARRRPRPSTTPTARRRASPARHRRRRHRRAGGRADSAEAPRRSRAERTESRAARNRHRERPPTQETPAAGHPETAGSAEAPAADGSPPQKTRRRADRGNDRRDASAGGRHDGAGRLRPPRGRGRETFGSPATLKRQGSSTAFVIPTRRADRRRPGPPSRRRGARS